MLKLIRSVLLGSVYLFLAILTLEVALRFLGFGPEQPRRMPSGFSPEPPIVLDEQLGYSKNVGDFTIDLQGLIWRFKHLTRTERNVGAQPKRALQQIHVLGCSFAYGKGLNDSACFSFLLNKEFNQVGVHNYAYSGYGTTHAYVNILSQLEKNAFGENDLVIYCYAYFHDQRNVWSRKRISSRKAIITWFTAFHNMPLEKEFDKKRWPWLKLNKDKQLELYYSNARLFDTPLKNNSALSAIISRSINDLLNPSANFARQVSFEAIKAMQDSLSKRNVAFLVCGIDNDSKTTAMLKRLQEYGVMTYDISVDVSDDRYNLMPYDKHPNEKANVIYFEKVKSAIHKYRLVSKTFEEVF